MATRAEILSYKGSGGLGSSADIPAIGTKDLEVVNNTLDRLQAQNSMRNQQIFQQRVKDRDALLGELDSGSIKVGDLLDQDMPTVKEGLQKLDEAYYKRIKKGINDIDAAREYKQALRDAQDRVTQAQARKISYDTLNGDIAKETLPRKQEAMKAHLDKTINGGFWKDLTPYQQTQDLDVAGSILSTAATEKQQYTDKNNPLLKGTRTLFDYDKTFLNNKDNFLNDANKRYDQQQLVGAIQSLPPQEFLETMQAVNNRIKEYNDLKGLQPGQPGFVKDVQFAINKQTGQAVINENVPDFAAKYTLAHQKPFNSAETELDKTALALMQEQEKQRHNRATEALAKNRLGLDWSKFNYAKSDDIGGANTILNEAKDIIDKGVETTIESGGKKIKVLRIGEPTLLKQFGNIDKDGNVTNVPNAIDYDRKTDQVKLIYYDDNLTESGKNQIVKEVSLDQRTWLKEIAKRSFPNKDLGKINTLVDDVLTKNGNSLYKLTQNEPEEKPSSDLSQYDIPAGAKVAYDKKGNVIGYELNGQKYKF